jgi:hypothetical protein
VTATPCQYASIVSEGDGRALAPLTTQSFKEDFMNLKLVVVLSLFTAIPAIGYAQNQPASPPPPPPPTLAEVQKLVQTISADKAKIQIYCQLAQLNEQIGAALDKKDEKTAEDLGKKADALADKMGPDYNKIMDGLGGVDENSPLGKQMQAAFDPLDKQCK